VLGAGVGVVLSPLLLLWADSDIFLQSQFAFIGSLFAAYYLVILVHELGHGAMAIANGFEFRQLAVAPFLLTRMARGFQFRFLPGRILSGGHLMAAPDSDRDLRRRYLRLLCGGPAGTLLVFLVLALLPRNVLVFWLLVWNIIVAATSWLPYYTQGLVTDAKGILLLTRPGPEADCLAALLFLVALDSQGKLPREWPPDVVAGLHAPGDTPLHARAKIFLLIYALDTGDSDAVAAAIESALAAGAHQSVDARRTCFSEAAFHHGVVRRDAAQARAWLEDARKIRGTAAEKGWDSAMLGAIAFAEGNSEAARAAFTKAIERLDRRPKSGSVTAARARLAALL